MDRLEAWLHILGVYFINLCKSFKNLLQLRQELLNLLLSQFQACNCCNMLNECLVYVHCLGSNGFFLCSFIFFKCFSFTKRSCTGWSESWSISSISSSSGLS